MKQLSIIIPAYNEELSIVSTIRAVRRMLQDSGIEGEIVVVNDCSSDSTGSLAENEGARVVTHRSNLGYGASLKTGIRSTSFPNIAIIDADGTYPAERLPDLLESMESGGMAVGARTGDTVRIPPLRRPAKWLLRKLANRITGTEIPDLNSGLRVFSRNLVEKYINLLPEGFSFTTTITVAALCDGYPVSYIPINYYKREGSSKIRPSHFPAFVVLVLRLAVLFKPLKVFLPVSVSLFILALAKLALDLSFAVGKAGLTLDLLTYPVISTTTVILLVSSLQVILVGMVAEALASRS